MSDEVAARVRVRIRFSKQGKVRFTSHRDTARIWERALRRAELPVAYTEGFSPRPKVSFGLALSTGHESLGEYLDVDLRASAGELEGLDARLDPALPAGFAVQGTTVVEPGTPSLQEAVTSCAWRLEVTGAGPGEVGAAVERLLGAGELMVTRERKGKGSPARGSSITARGSSITARGSSITVHEDVRPALLALAVIGPTPSGTELEAELATQPRALRVADVVALLCDGLPGAGAGRVCRTHQYLGAGASRREPLPRPDGLDGWSLAATAAPAPDRQPASSEALAS